MAPTGASFSALFNSHGALDMTQLTPTLAHSAGGTGKTNFTASVAVFLLSGLLSGVALADAIFEHGGHTYKIITEPASWSDASEAAGAMTLGSKVGYLARIDSAKENAAVLTAVTQHLTDEQLGETMAEDGSDVPFVWLGGSDITMEGVWTWSNNGDQFWSGDFNGSGVDDRYTNWGIQPDSATGAEDGLGMGLGDWPAPFYDLGSKGQWNDLDTGTPLAYVVEFDGTTDLRVSVEEPLQDTAHSGIGAIRGWAVSSDPIDRIEVFIDGVYRFDIPYGGLRREIGKAFPDIEGSELSGYASSVNFNGLSKGNHTLVVQVTDVFGSVVTRSVKFNVTYFDKGYLSASDVIELGWSNIQGLGDNISIEGARVDGEIYDIELKWRTKSQGFEIVRIEKQERVTDQEGD